MGWLRAKSPGLLVAAAAVAGGLAQTQTPPQPTFRTEANYVRVDAFPTANDAAVNDLTAGDFEVLENGVLQRIEQFEHVVIRGSVPQELRAEPATVAESRQALLNPRARVFVIFLDTGHVDVSGSHNIRKPLVDALDRLIGPDDLVAVMTPDMSPADLTFARRTTTIEGFLARQWPWGDKDKLNPVDPVEDRYQQCYGPPGAGQTSAIAAEMIARHREKLTLDAFDELVLYLRTAREERKAVIAVTDGWLIFAPNPALAPQTPPAAPQLGVDPRGGRLTGRTDTNNYGSLLAACERDRFDLSMLDDRDQFRQLFERANRANVSFYPVDPRGLPVFDSPISSPLPLATDAEYLRTRTSNLRTLAENTDGLAVVNSNDLARGFKRIVDDLSSYYLLGYYSSGKLDGKFHAITVRVKRPGVHVRARRGYLAATPAALRASTRTTAPARTDPAAAEKAAEAHVIDGAVGVLSGYTRDVPLRLQVVAGWKADGASAAMWLVGELGGTATVGDGWTDGFDATATLATTADATVATGQIAVPRGARTFRIALTPSQPVVAGEYVVRVAARAGAASIPSRETTHVTIPPPPQSTGVLYSRRGPATANRDVPTADLRFRRNEQVRVEIPVAAAGDVTARLLDRTGKALAVPVAAAVREDSDGSRWHTAQLGLAPLAAGDYVIEIASGNQRNLAAFRIVP